MDTPNHTKHCKYCQRDLPLTEFHARKKSVDGLSYKCKACASQYAKQLYQSDRPRFLARFKAYYEAHIEELRQYNKEYRERNKERLKRASYAYRLRTRERQKQYNHMRYQMDKDAVKRRVKQWGIDNPEKKEAQSRRRYARVRGASGSHTPEDLRLIQLAQTDRKGRVRCWWCGDPMTDWHVDHKLPLSRGGTNDASNLCLACAPCNLRKNAKTPDEFTGRLL